MTIQAMAMVGSPVTSPPTSPITSPPMSPLFHHPPSMFAPASPYAAMPPSPYANIPPSPYANFTPTPYAGAIVPGSPYPPPAQQGQTLSKPNTRPPADPPTEPRAQPRPAVVPPHPKFKPAAQVRNSETQHTQITALWREHSVKTNSLCVLVDGINYFLGIKRMVNKQRMIKISLK